MDLTWASQPARPFLTSCRGKLLALVGASSFRSPCGSQMRLTFHLSTAFFKRSQALSQSFTPCHPLCSLSASGFHVSSPSGFSLFPFPVLGLWKQLFFFLAEGKSSSAAKASICWGSAPSHPSGALARGLSTRRALPGPEAVLSNTSSHS